MKPRCNWRLAWIFLLAGPLSADWLVMRDGARLETQGAWKIKGAQVIFTLPSGTLSSLRLKEVDLDASALATVAATKPPPPEPETVKPQAAFVLTNEDLGGGGPKPQAPDPNAPAAEASADQPGAPGTPDSTPVPAGTAEGGAAAAPPEGSSPPTPPTPPPVQVEVTTWEQVQNPSVEGVEIRGMLRNAGQTLARDLVLNVTLFDAQDKIIAQGEAFVGKNLLSPGGTTDFRVIFPISPGFLRPDFAVRGRGPLYGEITGFSNPRAASEAPANPPAPSGSSLEN